MTVPAQPVPAQPLPTAAPVRTRRAWDVVLTIVGLVAYLVTTLIASASSFYLLFAADSCGASSVCNYDQISSGALVVAGGVWVPALFVVGVAIWLLVIRRLAFWVPLVGILLSIGIALLGFSITTSAVTPIG